MEGIYKSNAKINGKIYTDISKIEVYGDVYSRSKKL